MPHSKGPWKRSNNHSLFDTHEEGLKIIDADGNPVGTAVRGPNQLKRSLDEWNANGDLMAGAPRLLEVLEEAPEPDGLGIVGAKAFAEAYREWYEKRRAALIAAGGEV